MNPDRLAELRRLGETSSPAVTLNADAYRELLAAVRVPKRLGRPPAVFDRARAAEMRRQGLSYAGIARALGVGKATIYAALQEVRDDA